MSLKARLNTLLDEVGLGENNQPRFEPNSLPGSIDMFWHQKIQTKKECSTEDFVGFTKVSKKSGTLHLIRSVFPDQKQTPLAQATKFAHLIGDPRLKGFDITKALFLDIEATHIYQGAACQAFIIGIGFFDPEEGFVVEQILQSYPDNELPGLEHLLERIEEYPYLITFNGKSYDLTVLENRFVIQRLLSRREASIKLNPHIDLLHVCRRIWGGCYEDCRLGTLETHLLAKARLNDLPGRFAPDFYFEYLYSSNARYLEPILEHNLHDVRNLATLLQHSDEALSIPPLLHPVQIRANIGRWFLNRGIEDGLEALLSCLNAPLEARVKIQIFRACLRRLKQNHDIPGIESVLTRFRTAFPDQAEPLVELAKLHEHRYKNMNDALYFAIEAYKCLDSNNPSLKRETKRRIRRLQNRLVRKGLAQKKQWKTATG